MGPLLPLGHGGPLFLEIAMNQYINSGYQKREGLLIGYAETLTIAHDVLCVMTSRDQDGVIHAVVELLDGKASGMENPAVLLACFKVSNPLAWLNRLPDVVAIPACHLIMMADHRYLIDAFPGEDKARYLWRTVREQLVHQVRLALFEPMRALKRKWRRSVRKLQPAISISNAR